MRTLLRISLCIALGVITTVALAWSYSTTGLGLPWKVTNAWRPRLTDAGEGRGVLTATIQHYVGKSWVITQAAPDDWVPIASRPQGAPTPEASMPRRARKVALPWTLGDRAWPVEGGETIEVLTFGWPWRTMYALQVPGDKETWKNIWDLSGISGRFNRPRSSMPPGVPMGIARGPFLGSVAMWGTAWGAIIILPPAVRMWRRKSGGQCLACGYDLKGSRPDTVCPECGAFRAPAIHKSH
jgi:hypothetical protein